MSAGSGRSVASFASQSSVSLNLRWFGLSAISEKMPYARLVELEAVERDREVVLRELLVALVVARLALVDAIESERGVAPLLAVEEALRLRGLLGHLTGDGRGTAVGRLRLTAGRRGRLVELDRLVATGLATGLAGGLARGLARRGGFGFGFCAEACELTSDNDSRHAPDAMRSLRKLLLTRLLVTIE